MANIFLPEEVSGALDGCSVFIGAIFVAILVGTFLKNVGAVDALLLLGFSYGYFFSVYSLFGFRTRSLSDRKPIPISTLGTYMRIFISAAVACYAVWFWFDGIDKLDQPPCETVFFFFTTFEISKPGPRIAFRVLHILVAAYYGTIAIIAAVTLVKHFVIRLLSRAPRTDANLRFWEKFREKAMTKRGYVRIQNLPPTFSLALPNALLL